MTKTIVSLSIAVGVYIAWDAYLAIVGKPTWSEFIRYAGIYTPAICFICAFLMGHFFPEYIPGSRAHLPHAMPFGPLWWFVPTLILLVLTQMIWRALELPAVYSVPHALIWGMWVWPTGYAKVAAAFAEGS